MNFGCHGKGKVFADKFIEKIKSGEAGFSEWIDLFPTPEEALLNYRVNDCGQVNKGKLKLTTVEDIGELFDGIIPF